MEPVIIYNKCDLLQDSDGDGVPAATDGGEGVEEERVLGRSVVGGALKTGIVGPDVFELYRGLGYTVVETSSGEVRPAGGPAGRQAGRLCPLTPF